ILVEQRRNAYFVEAIERSFSTTQRYAMIDFGRPQTLSTQIFASGNKWHTCLLVRSEISAIIVSTSCGVRRSAMPHTVRLGNTHRFQDRGRNWIPGVQ